MIERIAKWLAITYAATALCLVVAEQVLTRARAGRHRASLGQDVWLRSEDGVRIYARYILRDPALPTLLYLHGGAGTVASRSDRLELFSSLGANLLAVEYRGYGLSEGESSERGFQQDADAAYTWLRQQTDARRIIAFGESMGGGVASWLAVNRKVGGLILLSTYTSAPAWFAHFMPWLPTRWLVQAKLDTLSRISRITVPKLFIHSRSDGVVPFAMAQALEAAAPEPKHHLWLDHAGHDDTFYKSRAQATEALRTFLRVYTHH